MIPIIVALFLGFKVFNTFWTKFWARLRFVQPIKHFFVGRSPPFCSFYFLVFKTFWYISVATLIDGFRMKFRIKVGISE